jgi:hypothetical protein
VDSFVWLSASVSAIENNIINTRNTPVFFMCGYR